MQQSQIGGQSEATVRPATDAIRSFIDYCRVAKGLSTNTIRAYEADLMDFDRHLGDTLSVTTVDRELLTSYARSLIDERRLRPTSVKRRLASLKVFFDWAERQALVSLSPFHRLDFPLKLPHRLPRALDTMDMRRLLRHAKTESRNGGYDALLTYFVVVVLFTTGLRVGELASALLEDVSEADASMRVIGKGNRERRVFLPGARASVILRQFTKTRLAICSDSRRLVIGEAGKPLSTHQLRTRLRRIGVKANLSQRVTPHMLRHTAATQLLEAGVDIRFVQRLLGHASISTTQIYAHVNDQALRDTLAKADTLGKLS